MAVERMGLYQTDSKGRSSLLFVGGFESIISVVCLVVEGVECRCFIYKGEFGYVGKCSKQSGMHDRVGQEEEREVVQVCRCGGKEANKVPH